MFGFSNTVTVGNERVFAFICLEHGELNPMCDVEISQRKSAQARKGVRAKIVREVHLRVSCKLCEKSELRKLEGVSGLLSE